MITRLATFPVKHPSAALLCVQILGIVLYPLMGDTSAERALFGAFGLVVLGVALYVVKRGPWLTGFAVVLALPVVVLSIWLAFDFDPGWMVIMAALEAVFYFYATGSLIAYMLEDEFASVDELFAAGATFTLLAWAFAYVYLVCQALLPGSFGALAGSGTTLERSGARSRGCFSGARSCTLASASHRRGRRGGDGQVLRGALVQTSALDPFTFASVVVLLGVIAVVGCLAPTCRASALDPAVAPRRD